MYTSPVRIELFQTIEDNQTNRHCPFSFMSISRMRRMGYNNPPGQYYRLVYSRPVKVQVTSSDKAILEQLFTKFNMPNRPGAKSFRSMSMSDVIGLYADDGSVKYYYCDTFGFESVEFDPGVVSKS